MARTTQETPEGTTPPSDPAAQPEGIEAGEYIAELEHTIGNLTGQLVQLQMVNKKLRQALTEKREA